MSDAAAATYAERGKLFALAYRMLGSAGDAEDVVQEAFVRWHAEPRDGVRNPRAFVTTIVTRLCLDQIKSARTRLEMYPGVWLPEPLGDGELDDMADPSQPTPEDSAQRLEAVSLAFLAVVQALSPIERAVYLLGEIFDYSHGEVAGILGRTPQACRQALHRARQALAAALPKDPPSDRHRALLVSFIKAVRQGELEELSRLLSEDVVSRADGGGYVTAAIKPVSGRRAVSRLYTGFSAKLPADLGVRVHDLHGWPTALLFLGDTLLAAVQVRITGNQICRVDNVMSPVKLQRLARSLRMKTSLAG